MWLLHIALPHAHQDDTAAQQLTETIWDRMTQTEDRGKTSIGSSINSDEHQSPICTMATHTFQIFALAVLAAAVQGGEKSSTELTSSLSIPSGFRLNWSHQDPEWITIKMSAPAKGFVAVGISPDGSMTGADMIMGWVDSDGKAHIKDTHGVGNTKPREDKVSNVELIRGVETESGTTIEFRRKWDTSDAEQDIAIKNETQILIWAYNQVDPKVADDDGVFRPPYHFENRGSIKRNLMAD